jgi:hypothetical protein
LCARRTHAILRAVEKQAGELPMLPRSKLITDWRLADATAAADVFASLHREGFATRNQVDALVLATRQHLPCAASVEMRARKGTVYLTLATPGIWRYTVSAHCNVSLAAMPDD